MIEVKSITSSKLSTFRTSHVFQHYGEFSTLDEFRDFREWARNHDVPIVILGNGSNILFTKSKIRSLVLKNRLNAEMKVIGSGRIEASSSLSIMRILHYCERNSLDSFYFLASVPATVGGAIAMNAGMAKETIFDFVESVTFIEGEMVVTLPSEEIQRQHRKTMFTGATDKLILSAVFRFPERTLEQSEIKKRIAWCHENQDLSAPNCGSVFRECDRNIMKRARWLLPWGIRIPFFLAQYSRKVNNWIICRNRRSWPIVCLIRIVQLWHRLHGKRAVPEVIEVD